ncbi:threonine-phosphate decarboxylase [Acetobacter sacchari]|uniref:threonine-phosphate decarboxylase n=2 Tax=Acetobacter sacchari TaxID=2661687 RepID=A0ABS3LVQ0_9PROT|nr:threonine-phosphate decarboxylase [Acetobacter sacchari]
MQAGRDVVTRDTVSIRKEFSNQPETREQLPFLPTHGGQVKAVMRHFLDAPRPFIDLSTGINPNAYPLTMPSLVSLTRLPEQDEEDDLRVAAAAAYSVSDPALVASGPGSQSLISLLPRILHANRACILGPTYSGHETAWLQAGISVRKFTDFGDLESQASQPGTVCVVCNPNNPDGRSLSAKILAALADRCAASGNYLVVDEAFADFDGESVASALPHPGLIVLRSFGKTYGLPGVRLGFLISAEPIAQRARDLLGSWPVSGLAIAAGRQALRDTAWLECAQLTARRARARLDGMLHNAGFNSKGDSCLFTLVETEHAMKVWLHLCRQGIVTRFFVGRTNFLRVGLPDGEAAWARTECALRLWREQAL